MAGSTGLEPAASAVTGQRSNQLNYDPAMVAKGLAETLSVRPEHHVQPNDFDCNRPERICRSGWSFWGASYSAIIRRFQSTFSRNVLRCNRPTEGRRQTESRWVCHDPLSRSLFSSAALRIPPCPCLRFSGDGAGGSSAVDCYCANRPARSSCCG